jgi:hypothetical protein
MTRRCLCRWSTWKSSFGTDDFSRERSTHRRSPPTIIWFHGYHVTGRNHALARTDSSGDRSRAPGEGDHVRPGGRGRRIPAGRAGDGVGAARAQGIALAPCSRGGRTDRSAGSRGSGTAPSTRNGGCDLPRPPSPHGRSWLDPEVAWESQNREASAPSPERSSPVETLDP